ncbi:MAG: 2-amino-3,7-dideoxy-D-threo-hept-6-ulosonate synthase [Ktedonobacteraceae bacterium]
MSELLGRRFHRLFSSAGRSVIIAMDHGSTDGVLAGFEDPEKVLGEVIAGGADAILTSIGIARHFSRLLKDVGLLIRCDGATSPLLPSSRELVVGIEDVLSSGADAAAAMYIPGSANDHGSTSYFPLLASEAHRWNVPVMAEALPYGFEAHPDARAVDAVANASRMAAENGADIVKTFYTGEPKSFEKIVRSCFVPVMVLGGPKTHGEREFLESLRDARDAGAAGVVIGRNVWQHPSPTAMTRALVAIFHHDATVDDALQILQDRLAARATKGT